jgi:Tat protein secretion system quality control protein TatD with DNase activity
MRKNSFGFLLDMHYSSIDDLCISSVSSHCDQRCGSEIHLPPGIPIFDGHIHLNQILPKIESDLVSAKFLPPIREYHFINNNHKPNEWLIPNPSPFSSHVHIYHTIGIHPKYFTPQSMYKNLNDLSNHLETSHSYSNITKRILAVGEFGLDETATASLDHQLFVLEKQIDLAIHFHLPIIIHCRGFHNYRTLFDCLVTRIPDRSIPIHWHCINSNSDLNVVDSFLNQFPNSFIGVNGSLTYENPPIFKNWLEDRSPFLPERLILETDYPYLMPRNLHGTYDPSCAILCTALYLNKMVGNHQHNLMSLLLSSNSNKKTMYNL